MDPETGRSVARARVGSGVAVAVLLLPFVGHALARAGMLPPGAPIVLGLPAVVVGALLLSALCEEHSPSLRGSSRLTARTLTGERSVDLDRIASVRLLTTFSYGRTYRTLLVRDVHGVRLGVTTERSRRAVRRAVERASAAAAHGGPRPRVSRAARAHLGLGTGTGLAAHTTAAFLLTVVSLCLYLTAVLRLGGG